MPMRMFVPLLLVFAVSPGLAAEHTHDITPDDYFTLATITEIALSPDGKQIAFCLASWDKADDSRKTDLWVVPTDGRAKPTRLLPSTSARPPVRGP